MKNLFCAMLAIVMLLGCMPGALAQEMVSIAELYDQAQAMGGWWKETFDTPNGEVTIDAPIIVPDVEKMPVITVEKAKISEELFNQIAQGKKVDDKEGEHLYEVELDGKLMEFFLGRDNYYVRGEQTSFTGYDAVQTLWIQHGGYRFSQGDALMKIAEPTTYSYPWMTEFNQHSLRNSDMTIEGAMRLWNEDIALCYPDEEFVIQPKTITARGSLLTNKSGSGKEYRRDGYFKMEAEQVIDGVPLINKISAFRFSYGSTQHTNRIVERLGKTYGVGIDTVLRGYPLDARFSSEENYRTMTELVRKRTVECADIPLVSLDSVIENVQKEIEVGNIRELYSIRLGYVLYSNPDMIDYAWAVPHWVVSALYITKAEQKSYDQDKKMNAKWGYEFAPWEERYYEEYLISAQTAEMVYFTTGDEKTFSVPEITTWDKVQ